MKRVVLAYSGGLDTSVCIKWLQENYGYEVIALTVDLGEEKDLQFVRNKALQVGATSCHVAEVKDEFALDYVLPALKANLLYEGKYPLASALSRPLIANLLVEAAETEKAEAVAHGCTGKGNDQVRFDVSVKAQNPDLQVVAPVREWPMSRVEQIAYAKKHNIPVPVDKHNPFSIDLNIWGRSVECGALEDPWAEPPEEAYEWTISPAAAPDEAEYVKISFEQGKPVAINDERMQLVSLIEKLNMLGGRHGVGRIDHVENRLVGIKSREVYEAPAATLLIAAHKELESLTLTRELTHYKTLMEKKFAEITYSGLWYSPLKEAIEAFIDSTQTEVTGEVRLKLFKGAATVVGRKSPNSLYDFGLATYGGEDDFDHRAAEGFINIWGLPITVYSAKNGTDDGMMGQSVSDAAGSKV